MNLFRQLYPEARIVLLLRHPGGQVASALKAIANEKIDGQPPATEDWGIYEDLAATEQGRRHGLTLTDFRALDPVERLAWRWSISNDKALADLEGQSNVQVALYEDLCKAPVPVARSLFAFAGLDWHPSVERFALNSSSAGNATTYDRVIRDSAKTASAWHRSLKPEQIRLIDQVMRRSRAGQYYL
jgi:hypothetical protein